MSRQGRSGPDRVRRMKLRKPLLATTVAAAALSLSGCVWGTQIYWPSQDPFGVTTLTTKRWMSKSVVDNCSSRHPGDSRRRALCALDTVAGLCATQDVLINGNPHRADWWWCERWSEHSTANISSMQRAISDVLNGSGVCLGYGPYSPWSAVKDDEVGRAFGCT